MKKFLATILLLAAAFTLFACDNGDEGGTDNPSGSNGSLTKPASNVTITIRIEQIYKKYFTGITMVGEDEIEYRVNHNSITTYTVDGITKNSYELKSGMVVKVTYNGMVTRSLPPQITAIDVEIISKGDESAALTPRSSASDDQITMTATVKSIDDGITVEVIESGYAAGTYVIYTTESTLITDSIGNSITVSDISVGDTLYIEYEGAVTLSLPPKTTATSIIRYN